MFGALHKILTAVWEGFIMMICCNEQAALPLTNLAVVHFRSRILLLAGKNTASLIGRSFFHLVLFLIKNMVLLRLLLAPFGNQEKLVRGFILKYVYSNSSIN